MCGIIAVLRRPSARPAPSIGDLTDELEAVARDLGSLAGRADASPGTELPGTELAARLAEAAERVAAVDAALRGEAGLRALLADSGRWPAMEQAVAAAEAAVGEVERALDAGAVLADSDGLEGVNASVVALKDALWAVGRDRLPTAGAVADLAGRQSGPAAVAAYASVQCALSALDRLEVRGRDSAGLQVLVRGHDLDLDRGELAALAHDRLADPLFSSLAVRRAGDALAFVYKAAAEIGELGDNTRVLREAVAGDELLRAALRAPTARAVVLGHTRWASVGIISQANAHPLNHEEEGGPDGPYVAAVLNGDVDNHPDLKADESLAIRPEITTDAKVVPALVSRRCAVGDDPDEAFRRTVARLDGSVAVTASVAATPDRLHLALRGSGQALYVGLAEDAFVVASEPYGLVEETGRYLRLDGETPADPSRPDQTRGQIVVLDEGAAGDLAGVRRLAYDGTELPVHAQELATAAITTRDIDRGDHPHFLLKELHDAPDSFRKTLRGRVGPADDGRLTVRLGDEVLPTALRQRLHDGGVRRVVVIGQGTAAVAGESVAEAFTAAVASAEAAGRTPVVVEALPATELSGFGLRDDMSDTLVVAISQSGTTTDTNRTVDLVRRRGAAVVAIVNRRNSDLTDKVDGVLYTSDGRDVEMAVPSTKAFYAQVAAGFLLSLAVAEELGVADPDRRHELLAGLRGLPAAMREVLAAREEIAAVARRHAPARRHWAVVGNGPNRIAAREVRIKLSELCYKSIAVDATEDKKHIDLSAEPLVVVCAAGLRASTADDVAKEVAIYRAHKAAPVVVTTEGDSRFAAALDVITVPHAPPELAFVLSAMAGHLFGYEAAVAIDALANPLRLARAAIETTVASVASVPDGVDGHRVLDRLVPRLRPHVAEFVDALRAGHYDGTLDAATAVRLVSLLRYADGIAPLDTYQLEHGKVGTPGVVVEDLTLALTRAIDELTRPIDAIKHQAKTVTVGISRADESLLRTRLAEAVLEAGAARDRLSYRTLRLLADLEPALEEVTGFTRYRVDGEPGAEAATVHVVDKGGVARDIPSRTERDPALRGTKHRVAMERSALVAIGRSDGRPVLIVPEVKDNQTVGLTLLHLRLTATLDARAARQVLEGYRNRYAALRDAVTETEPTFRDDLLADVPVVELLTSPVGELADRWRVGG